MELLFSYVFMVATLVEGSSLWSFSHSVNKELYFNVEHDVSGVRVEAFVKDLSFKNENKTKIRFFLFTKDLVEGIELRVNDSTTLSKSQFNFEAELKVLIHGFANSASSTYSTLMKNAYLRQKKYNIIVVDWSPLCIPPFYSSAVDNANQVGAATTELVLWMVSQGLNLSRIHILGHSVGAHIAGVVGRTITSQGLGRVPRITGLDPAKPMFEREAASFRLGSHDAKFVDCVHTCGGFLGLSDASCHADFYPNGGTSPQPGCQFDIFGICSHQRAYKYYIESITHPDAFKAVECSAIESYSPTNCSSQSKTIMGEYLDVKTRGIFYVSTGSRSPFSLKNSTSLVSDFKRFSWYFL